MSLSRVWFAKKVCSQFKVEGSIVEYCVDKADEVVSFLFSQYRECYHYFNFKGWKYRYIFIIGGGGGTRN